MSKYFQIKNCPLCQKILYLKYIDGFTVAYRCPQFAPSPEWDPSLTTPHYEVSVSTGYPSGAEQTTIIPPYIMKTISGTGRTKVYKWYHHATVEDNLIMDVPILLPDREPAKMLERIKGLILFS